MENEIQNSIKNALNYFGEFSILEDQNHLSEVNDIRSPVKQNSADGLFCFCFTDDTSELLQTVADRVKKASYILKGFASLVTSKILFFQRDTNEELYNIPIEDMIVIVKKLPIMSYMEPTQYQKGIIIAMEGLSTGLVHSLIAEVSSIPVNKADEIASYLINSIEEKKYSERIEYNYISLTGIINVSGNAGAVKIETILRIGGISVVSELETNAATDLTNKGISEKAVKLHFTSNEFSGRFDYDLYENDMSVQEEIDKLILNYELDAVRKSAKYFTVPPAHNN